MSTDSEVIQASLTSPEEFEDLYDRHATAVYRYLTRRLGSQSAEDITSETFMAAFDSRDRFDLNRDSAVPWLLGIATNLSNRHLRHTARSMAAHHKAAVSDAELVSHPMNLVTERLDHSAGTSELMRSLNQLAPANRDCLLLHVWGDLSYQAIASALEIPVDTVRSRLHRARLTLRSHLPSTRGASAPTSSPSPVATGLSTSQETHHA
ncbi:RNA polymerase sigma factor [Kocuria sp. ZOR0020]|uniref:RNA polymerase sigma factor n=1 Tax=Kocuria sp. ZOR0020 TaxID=1339234 RepID=UPI00068A121F|nr:RNA polymerase sigma factor [Kocuria sp. ZOR0020]